jgi:hypothetical protein
LIRLSDGLRTFAGGNNPRPFQRGGGEQLMGSRKVRGHRAGRVISVIAGAIALVAIPFGTASAGNGLKPNQVFTGVTSQGSICGSTDDQPCTVTAQLTKKMTKVHLAWRVKATCDNGTTIGSSNHSLKPLRINRHGKVNVTFVANGDGTQSDTGLHFVAKVETPINLAFKRRVGWNVDGTISESADLTYDDGTTTRCTVAPATFTLLPA